jgi:hypothetical protein
MGLEFLFGPAALLIFVAFLMVATIMSAMVFRKGFNQLGWHRVRRGYLGVFAAVVAVTVVSVKFPFDNFLSHMLLQSYFAFAWAALFVAPLVFWLMPRGKPVLPVVMGAVCIWVCAILLLVTSRVVLSGDSLLSSGSIRSALVSGGWSFLTAYCFCFAAGIRWSLLPHAKSSS